MECYSNCYYGLYLICLAILKGQNVSTRDVCRNGLGACLAERSFSRGWRFFHVTAVPSFHSFLWANVGNVWTILLNSWRIVEFFANFCNSWANVGNILPIVAGRGAYRVHTILFWGVHCTPLNYSRGWTPMQLDPHFVWAWLVGGGWSPLTWSSPHLRAEKFFVAVSAVFSYQRP